MPTAGDVAHNPGMCPDWELNWGPFGSQASTESIEPHQSGNSSYHPLTKTPHGFLLYYSAKANIKKYHGLIAFNNIDSFSHSSGG